MAEMTISSPSPMFCLPYDWATRLIPSVVPRTKMTSWSLAALINWRILDRAPS